jgi:hypothetical protein
MLEGLFQLADLDQDEPVRMSERRGHVTVDLARTLYTPAGRDELNGAITEMLESGHWFQLYRGEIVSMQSPATPRPASAGQLVCMQGEAHELPEGEPRLIVRYVLDDRVDDGKVRLKQGRGWVTFSMSPSCFTLEGLACNAADALTVAGQAILLGGQWIQVWDGEIITMYDGPDESQGKDSRGGVYRGSMADQTP